MFTFEEKNLRTKMIDGNPWFCLRDLCDILEIIDTKDVANRISQDARVSTDDVDSLGRKAILTFVSEEGLYRAIFQSRKPEAEKFTTWVTKTVLPSIRKKGFYSNQVKSINPAAEALVSLQSYLSMGALLGASVSLTRAEAVQYVNRQHDVNLKPLLAENVSDTQDRLATVTEIGREFDLSAKATNIKLAELGLQIKGSEAWELTDLGKKYGQYLNVGKQHSDGTPIQQVKWYKEKTLNFLKGSK
jgi:anti-repressor protein